MAEKKYEVSESAKRELDSYGFAKLSTGNERVEIGAMRSFYGTVLDKADPLISNALDYAEMAKSHLQVKAQYDAAKTQYDAAPKDERGEFKLKDPGQLNQELAGSLQSTRGAADLYSEKRLQLMSEMSPAQLLAYNSDSDGKPILEMPKNIQDLLKNSYTPMAKLKNDNNGKILTTAVVTTDNYKIHGILNTQVEKEMAERTLGAMSSGLEKITTQEAKKNVK